MKLNEMSNISITNQALISMLENIAETHFFFFKFKHGQPMIGKSFYYTASDDEEVYAINGQFNLNEVSDIFHITPKSSQFCSEFELYHNILKQRIDNQCPIELEELTRNHVVSVQLVNGLNAWVSDFENDEHIIVRKGEPRLFLQFSNTAVFASASQIKSINCAIKFR